jgi:hypothetical protein
LLPRAKKGAVFAAREEDTANYRFLSSKGHFLQRFIPHAAIRWDSRVIVDFYRKKAGGIFPSTRPLLMAERCLRFQRAIPGAALTTTPFQKEVPLLLGFSFFIVLFALLLAVAALLREVRLRRALERLLKRLLERWRK